MNDNNTDYPHYLDEMPSELKEMWEKATDKQKKFIVYYVETGNARQSMIRAGYSKTGARQAGYRLLTYVYVKPIADWMSDYIITNALDTSISTAAERMQILTDMSRATIEDFTDSDGDINISLEGSNPANVKELKNTYDEDGNRSVTVKMYSSIDAIKELNKMQGSHGAIKTRNVDVNDNDIPATKIEIVTRKMTKEEKDDIGFTES